MSLNPEVGKRVRTGAFDTNVYDEGAGAPLLPEGARREMAAKLARCGATSVAVAQHALRDDSTATTRGEWPASAASMWLVQIPPLERET